MISPDDVVSYVNLGKQLYLGVQSPTLARQDRDKFALDVQKVLGAIESSREEHNFASRVENFEALWSEDPSRLQALLKRPLPLSSPPGVNSDPSSSSSSLSTSTELVAPTPMTVKTVGIEWVICGAGGERAAASTSEGPDSPSAPDGGENGEALPRVEVEEKDLVVLRFLHTEASLKTAAKNFQEVFDTFDADYPPTASSASPPAVSAEMPPPPPLASPTVQGDPVTSSIASTGMAAGDLLYYFCNGCETPYNRPFLQCKAQLDACESDWSDAKLELQKRVDMEVSVTITEAQMESALQQHLDSKKGVEEVGAKVDMVLDILTMSEAEIISRRCKLRGEKLFFEVRDACKKGALSSVQELKVMWGTIEPGVFDYTCDLSDGRGALVPMSTLGYAAKVGNVECVRFLLESGAPVDFGGQNSPLVLASEVNRPEHVQVVELLLSRQAEVNRPAVGSGRHALFFAIGKLCVDTTRVLLTAGADCSQADNSGTLPAQVALEHVFLNIKRLKLTGDEAARAHAVIGLLLDVSAPIPTAALFHAAEAVNYPKAFAEAAETAKLLTRIFEHPNYANLGLENAYLDKGSAGAGDREGSLLYRCVEYDYLQGAEALVVAGARVTPVGGKPASAPLFYAVAKTADFGLTWPRTRTCAARPWDARPMVSALLKARDLDLASTDYLGQTVFMLAVQVKAVEVLKLLLAALASADGGAAVDRVLGMRDRKGRTAVHHAVLAKSSEALSLLLAAGADAASRDREGKSPALLAAELVHFACLKVLLGSGSGGGGSSVCGPEVLELVKEKVLGSFDGSAEELLTPDGSSSEAEAEDEGDRLLQVLDLLLSQPTGEPRVEAAAPAVGGGCGCLPGFSFLTSRRRMVVAGAPGEAAAEAKGEGAKNKEPKKRGGGEEKEEKEEKEEEKEEEEKEEGGGDETAALPKAGEKKKKAKEGKEKKPGGGKKKGGKREKEGL